MLRGNAQSIEAFQLSLQNMSGAVSRCGTKWDGKHSAYRCRDCGVTTNSCMCVHCFDFEDHVGHDFFLYTSGLGGCCDCGDPHAWRESGFCSRHSGRTLERPELILSPPDRIRIHAVMSAVITKVAQMTLDVALENANTDRATRHGSNVHGALRVYIEQLTKWAQHFCSLNDGVRRLVALACTSLTIECPRDLLANSGASTAIVSDSKAPVNATIKPKLTGDRVECSALEFLIAVCPAVPFAVESAIVSFALEVMFDMHFKRAFALHFVKYYNRYTLRVFQQPWVVDTLDKITVQLFTMEELTEELAQNNQLFETVMNAYRACLLSATVPLSPTMLLGTGALPEHIRNSLGDGVSNYNLAQAACSLVRVPSTVPTDQSAQGALCRNMATNRVVHAAHEVVAANLHWQNTHDLRFILSHTRIASMFVRKPQLLKQFYQVLATVQGMYTHARRTAGVPHLLRPVIRIEMYSRPWALEEELMSIHDDIITAICACDDNKSQEYSSNRNTGHTSFSSSSPMSNVHPQTSPSMVASSAISPALHPMSPPIQPLTVSCPPTLRSALQACAQLIWKREQQLYTMLNDCIPSTSEEHISASSARVRPESHGDHEKTSSTTSPSWPEHPGSILDVMSFSSSTLHVPPSPVKRGLAALRDSDGVFHFRVSEQPVGLHCPLHRVFASLILQRTKRWKVPLHTLYKQHDPASVGTASLLLPRSPATASHVVSSHSMLSAAALLTRSAQLHRSGATATSSLSSSSSSSSSSSASASASAADNNNAVHIAATALSVDTCQSSRYLFAQLVLEAPLRCVVFTSQVFAGRWSRNGETVYDPAYIYVSPSWMDHGFDMDLTLIQVSGYSLPSSLFLNTCIRRFECDKLFEDGGKAISLPAETDPSGAGAKRHTSQVELWCSAARDLLQLLVRSVSPFSLLWSEKHERIRQELIHALSVGPQTHSQLVECMPRTLQAEQCLDETLNTVAEFQRARGVSQGSYRLRTQAWQEFDAFFAHFAPRRRAPAEHNFASHFRKAIREGTKSECRNHNASDSGQMEPCWCNYDTARKFFKSPYSADILSRAVLVQVRLASALHSPVFFNMVRVIVGMLLHRARSTQDSSCRNSDSNSKSLVTLQLSVYQGIIRLLRLVLDEAIAFHLYTNATAHTNGDEAIPNMSLDAADPVAPSGSPLLLSHAYSNASRAVHVGGEAPFEGLSLPRTSSFHGASHCMSFDALCNELMRPAVPPPYESDTDAQPQQSVLQILATLSQSSVCAEHRFETFHVLRLVADNNTTAKSALVRWLPVLYEQSDCPSNMDSKGCGQSGGASTRASSLSAPAADAKMEDARARRKRLAKERQKALLAKFAAKQTAFSEKAKSSLSAGASETVATAQVASIDSSNSTDGSMDVVSKLTQQIEYECAICFQRQPASLQNPIGFVALLQPSGLKEHEISATNYPHSARQWGRRPQASSNTSSATSTPQQSPAFGPQRSPGLPPMHLGGGSASSFVNDRKVTSESVQNLSNSSHGYSSSSSAGQAIDRIRSHHAAAEMVSGAVQRWFTDSDAVPDTIMHSTEPSLSLKRKQLGPADGCCSVHDATDNLYTCSVQSHSTPSSGSRVSGTTASRVAINSAQSNSSATARRPRKSARESGTTPTNADTNANANVNANASAGNQHTIPTPADSKAHSSSTQSPDASAPLEANCRHNGHSEHAMNTPVNRGHVPNPCLLGTGAFQVSTGVQVQTCGHYLHYNCYKTFIRMQCSADNLLQHPEIRSRLNILAKEFTCPVCRRHANALLPVAVEADCAEFAALKARDLITPLVQERLHQAEVPSASTLSSPSSGSHQSTTSDRDAEMVSASPAAFPQSATAANSAAAHPPSLTQWSRMLRKLLKVKQLAPYRPLIGRYGPDVDASSSLLPLIHSHLAISETAYRKQLLWSNANYIVSATGDGNAGDATLEPPSDMGAFVSTIETVLLRNKTACLVVRSLVHNLALCELQHLCCDFIWQRHAPDEEKSDHRFMHTFVHQLGCHLKRLLSDSTDKCQEVLLLPSDEVAHLSVPRNTSAPIDSNSEDDSDGPSAAEQQLLTMIWEEYGLSVPSSSRRRLGSNSHSRSQSQSDTKSHSTAHTPECVITQSQWTENGRHSMLRYASEECTIVTSFYDANCVLRKHLQESGEDESKDKQSLLHRYLSELRLAVESNTRALLRVHTLRMLGAIPSMLEHSVRRVGSDESDESLRQRCRHALEQLFGLERGDDMTSCCLSMMLRWYRGHDDTARTANNNSACAAPYWLYILLCYSSLPFLRQATMLRCGLDTALEIPADANSWGCDSIQRMCGYSDVGIHDLPILVEYEVLCSMLNIWTCESSGGSGGSSGQLAGLHQWLSNTTDTDLKCASFWAQTDHCSSAASATDLMSYHAHRWPVDFALLQHTPRFISLPKLYQAMYMEVLHEQCSHCGTVPTKPAVCLLCGTLVCFNETCCKRMMNGRVFEGYAHSRSCCGGQAVYLLIPAVSMYLMCGERRTHWPSIYLDSHGEEDEGLRRGKPLMLSEERFNKLELLWATNRMLLEAHTEWLLDAHFL
jgi:Proteolysis_6 C-terminal/E3 ubiquitin-protein ligase UBR1-like, winged-helix domain/Putative zinc finger in N-recognin (UBR box)